MEKKRTQMKRLSLITLLLLLLPAGVHAQGNSPGAGDGDARTMQLIGSPSVQLTIEPSAWGSEVAEDSDESTTLMWSRGQSRSKITVSTFSPGQQFDLFVEAVGVDNGQASGRIKLVDGMADTDLVVRLNKNKSGSARIVYTASASVSEGNSQSGFSDVHTVTYTVTDM